jgi:methylated-DNA-protein-cysteine methyltransferase-like protein
MPRTDEAEAFYYAVYSAIQEIPPGKVTSYGHIARLVGTRESRFLPLLLSNLQTAVSCLFFLVLYSEDFG